MKWGETMEEAIEFLTRYKMIEVVGVLYFVITIITLTVRAVEKGLKKLSDWFTLAYNKKRGKEIEDETIDSSVKKLENLFKRVEQMEQQQKDDVEMLTEHENGVLDKLESLSNVITQLSNEVKNLSKQSAVLEEKIDKQKEEIDKANKDNRETDCAVLRDRISGGMRYFKQNTDEEGRVHISIGDHENLEALYQEYFKKNGNGTYKQMYNNEFKHFIIDR